MISRSVGLHRKSPNSSDMIFGGVLLFLRYLHKEQFRIADTPATHDQWYDNGECGNTAVPCLCGIITSLGYFTFRKNYIQPQ